MAPFPLITIQNTDIQVLIKTKITQMQRNACIALLSPSESFPLTLSGFLAISTYLELILLVFGALVKGPVISEPPDVIELVEAFDVVRHSVSLQHVLTLWDGGDCVDLQVWKQRELRKACARV